MFNSFSLKHSLIVSLVLTVGLFFGLELTKIGFLPVFIQFAIFVILIIFLFKPDTAFYIAFFLFLVTFTVPLGFASPYTPGKTADMPIYQVLIPLLFISIMMKKIIKKESIIKSSPLNIPLIMWFGLIFVTYFRNPIFLEDLFGSKPTGQLYHLLYFTMLDICFYVSVVDFIKKESQIKRIIKMMFIIFTVVVLISIVRLFLKFEIPGLTDYSWRVHHSATFAISRIGVLGSYSTLGMLTLLCFHSLNLPKNLRLMLGLLFIFGVILSGGRVAALSMLLVIMLYLVVKKKRIRFFGLIVSILIFFLIAIAGLSPFSIYNLRIFQILPGPTPGGYSTQGRLLMWNLSLNLIKQSPIFGIGYGSNMWNYIAFSKNPVVENVAGASSHNLYLSILVNFGLIGLAFFLWLWISCLKTVRKLYKNYKNGFMKELTLWVTLYLISRFVASFFEGSPYDIFRFFLFGVVTAVYTLQRKIGLHKIKNSE